MRGQVKTQAKAPAHPMSAPPVSMFQARPFRAHSESDESSSFEPDGSSLFGTYLQRRAAGVGHHLGTPSTSPIIQRQENNTGLPDHLKAGIESLSGIAMDDVHVHYNSSKPAQLDALAYAQGTDIHLGAGQERHLPHEAWHVVQQKQGRVSPTMQLGGRAINDDSALESEADVMGAQMNGLSRNGINNSALMGHHSTPRSIMPPQTPIQMKPTKDEDEEDGFEFLEELGEQLSDMAGDAVKVVRRFFRKSAPPKRGPIEELPFKSQSFNDALEGRQKGITALEVRDERARREDEEHVRHLKYLNQGIEETQEILREDEGTLKENELTLRMDRFRASLAGKSPQQLSRAGSELDVNYASDPDMEELRHILREEKLIRHVIAQKPEDQSYDTYIAALSQQADEANSADEAQRPKKKKRKGLFKLLKSKDEPQEPQEPQVVLKDEDNFGLQAILAEAHKERIVQYLDPLINKVGASGENIHKSKKFYLTFLLNRINQELEFIGGEFDASQLHEFKKQIESELEARNIETIVSQRGGISHLKEELEAKKQKNIEEMAQMFEPKESLFGKVRNKLRSDQEKQQLADELAARVERERKEWQEIERIIKLYESRQ